MLLLRSGAISLSAASGAIWRRLGGSTLAVGSDIRDVEGHLAAWCERHGAIAAIVRPDFYTYAAPATAEALQDAMASLVARLHLFSEIAAQGDNA